MTQREWDTKVIYPVILAVMAGLVAISIVGLLAKLFPSYNFSYLVVFCVAASVEAYYAFQLFLDHLRRLSGTWKYRAAEAVGWYVLLVLAINLSEGRPLLDRLPYFGPEVLGSAPLIAIFWLMGFLTARDLKEISEPPLPGGGLSLTPRELLLGRFLGGGALLLVCAGLSRTDAAQLFTMNRPSVPGIIFTAALYFLLGAAFLMKANYTDLTYQWREQGVRLAQELSGRWIAWSAGFLAIVALISFVLPTGYTTGLIETVKFFGSFLWGILSFIIKLLLFPILWLLSLFGGGESKQLHQKPVVPPHLPKPPPHTPGGGADWAGLIKSAVFWVIVLAVAIYLVRMYLNTNPGILRAVRNFRGVRGVRAFLSLLWKQIRGYARTVNEHLPREAVAALLSRRGARRNPIAFSRGARTPREQVIRYYTSVLERARTQGYPRRGSQTPSEYNSSLGPHLQDAEPDMDELTRLFVEARYSVHEVERDDAGRGRSYWSRVTSALKALRKPRENKPN